MEALCLHLALKIMLLLQFMCILSLTQNLKYLPYKVFVTIVVSMKAPVTFKKNYNL